jgi:DsbC/DsbD-like thiol-disulfide interchange protein
MRLLYLSFLGFATVTALSSFAMSQDVSDWSRGHRSAVRLVAGAGANGTASAGIEIKLSPNFKTYWRSPGDSGLPPRFDWGASENLGSVNISWPAPERFGDGAGFSVGYKSDVVLPMRITAADPSKPVKLILNLDYAVCEKICIPAQGKAELVLPVQFEGSAHGAIRAAKKLVPLAIALGETTTVPTIMAAMTSVQGDKTVIMLDGKGIPDRLEAFVEGPDMWAFSVPQISATGENSFTVTMAVEDRPKNSIGTVPFSVTLRHKDGAIETRFDLDMPRPKQ